jgi:hypothetical protein
MSAELIGTVIGYGADPTRRGPNVLVCKCGTPCIKQSIGGAIFNCLTAATVICIKLKSTGKFRFYLQQPCQMYRNATPTTVLICPVKFRNTMQIKKKDRQCTYKRNINLLAPQFYI